MFQIALKVKTQILKKIVNQFGPNEKKPMVVSNGYTDLFLESFKRT